jgi:hypothetical protein
MSNQTKVNDQLVSLASGRGLSSKLADILSALDFGASVAGSAAANTTALNLAIVAAGTSGSGFVLVPVGVSYTESGLAMQDSVTLIVFGSAGTITFLTKSQGDSPVAGGGIAIKAQGKTGVLLRAVDYGVSTEPLAQVVDSASGDLAAVECKFMESSEITDPTAPSANRARIYCKDNGSGKTQLVVRFPTGAVQQLAIEP